MIYQLIDDYDNELIGYVETQETPQTVQKYIGEARQLDIYPYDEIFEYVGKKINCEFVVISDEPIVYI